MKRLFYLRFLLPRYCLFLLLIGWHVGSAQVPLIDFEDSSGYTLNDSIDLYGNWLVLIGSALISDSAANSGSQSLRIGPYATGGSEVSRLVSLSGSSVVFADLWLRPVAGGSLNTGTLLDIDGSEVRFVIDGSDGLVAVRDGDNQGGSGNWLEVDSFAIDGNHAASSWLRLTIRQDFAAGSWDVYLNDQMLAADLGFFDSVNVPTVWSFHGDENQPTYVDDLSLSAANPLFADSNQDGIPDSWYLAHGIDPQTADRNADPDGDGLSTLEEFLQGKLPTIADYDGGVTTFYYVDNSIGADSYNGLAAVPVGGNGPKETVSAMIAAATTESTIILLEGSTQYSVSTLNPSGKSVGLRPVGSVRLEVL